MVSQETVGGNIVKIFQIKKKIISSSKYMAGGKGIYWGLGQGVGPCGRVWGRVAGCGGMWK